MNIPATNYLNGKVLVSSLPVFQSAPPSGTRGPKRLVLPQGELANFYDGEEGIRYLAYIELRQGAVRGNHWHEIKEEQLYIISGELRLVAQEGQSGQRVSIGLRTGDWVMIRPGIVHALQTIEAGQAIEFSKNPFDATDIQRLTLI